MSSACCGRRESCRRKPPRSLPQAPLLTGLVKVEELDRKPSSCPFLFTWNGTKFEFLTDFLGGGEMGYWEAPGLRNTPDPDEYVRIPGDKLQPRDGRLDLRVTNELEEALFFDRAQLVAVAHPRGTDGLSKRRTENHRGAVPPLHDAGEPSARRGDRRARTRRRRSAAQRRSIVPRRLRQGIHPRLCRRTQPDADAAAGGRDPAAASC